MRCKKCRSRRVTKAGFRVTKGKRSQRYQCQKCGYVFIPKEKKREDALIAENLRDYWKSQQSGAE